MKIDLKFRKYWRRYAMLLIALLIAITAFILIKIESSKNPFSFQEITTFGAKYQEYSPKAGLKDNQRQIKITLPASDKDVLWESDNKGCEMWQTDGAVFNAVPVRAIDFTTENTFAPGSEYFVSCLADATIFWWRNIEAPAAVVTATPEPTPLQ